MADNDETRYILSKCNGGRTMVLSIEGHDGGVIISRNQYEMIFARLHKDKDHFKIHRSRDKTQLNYSSTQILTALAKYNAPMTIGKISEVTGRVKGTVSSVLTKLTSKNLSARVGDGIYEITEKGADYILAMPTPIPSSGLNPPLAPTPEPINPWPEPSQQIAQTQPNPTPRQGILKPLRPIGRLTSHDREP